MTPDPSPSTAVLVIASPKSNWVAFTERHRATRDVTVLFAHQRGAALVREVGDRLTRLRASGVVLGALACVGVAEIDALRELASTVGLPLIV